MSLPSAVGTFSYNGHTFNSSTRTVVRGKPLYDQADRTVISVVFTITAVEIIQSASGTDATMLDTINRLSKPGQQLRYTSQGFAPLTINVAGVRDTMWGPKPRVVDCRPVGSSQAWELVWTCEVAIPMCDTAKYAFAVMAFNYEVDFTIDADGYSSRVITGYVEIPMTRVAGGTRVPDSADAYREQINPDIPPGFARKDRSFHLSADKRRLDFTFVDEQIPNGGAYPAGVVHFEGSNHVANEPNNWVRFNATLQATYTVPPGVSRTVAADAFYALLADRARQSEKKGRIFHSFSATEGLGANRKISFSCSWAFMSTVVDCLTDSGFWRPLPNTDWGKWITSDGVRQAQSVRGHAGLRFFAQDDAIIDLCIGGVSTLKRVGTPGLQRLRRVDIPAIPTTIKPEQSWFRYKVRIVVLSQPSIARMKYLPTNKQPTNNGYAGSPGLLGMGDYQEKAKQGTTFGDAIERLFKAAKEGNKGKLMEESGFVPDAIQQRASTTYRVALEGSAIRAGYKIPLPKLVTIGGVEAIPSAQKATTDIPVANWSGVPIYARQFRLEYELAEPPDNAKIEVPGNPAIMVDR